MINIQMSDFLIRTITFFLAYIAATTCAGVFKAWVAKKLGDETPEEYGFLSFNPIEHMDFIGLGFLFLFGFGWARHIPINSLLIHKPFRYLKLAAAYFSDSCAHFFMGLVGTFLLIISFGTSILPIIRYITLWYGTNFSHIAIAQAYPNHSSAMISMAFILIAFTYLNVVLCVLNFIINLVTMGITVTVERTRRYELLGHSTYFLISFFLILFFSRPLRLLAINTISYVGYYMAYVLGMA